MSIEVNNLTKSFKGKKVLDEVSFKVEDGEILAVVGLSGAGKSTILKLICGLTKPDSGEIKVSEGDIAMVFQYSALFDSLNVYENIAFALKERKEFKHKYTEEQLQEIIKDSRNNSNYRYEKNAFYNEEYKEIVFQDVYTIDYENGETTNNVGWADIDKIIYCEKTLNVIFVCFHANDSFVHDVDEVEYFKKFSIDQEEYVTNIEDVN